MKGERKRDSKKDFVIFTENTSDLPKEYCQENQVYQLSLSYLLDGTMYDQTLVPVAKVRGRKKSLQTLVDRMEEQIRGYEAENTMIAISHGDCLEDASYVANLVKERLGIEQCMINYVGSTIGANSGPGTIALFFVGSPR